MLYPGSRFRMADDLLEAYLRQLIEAHARVPEVTIAWQGGEPTLMGARLLPPLGRAGRPVPEAGPAGRAHDPDERHAARRGVGGVLQGARVPGRDLDRRAARDARRLPREQGRQGLVRPGDARARPPARRRGRVERADDDPRRQRGHGREVYRFLRDECGARFVQFIPIIERVAEAARGRRRCRGRRGATGRCTCRRATASPAARSPASSTAAS